MNDERLRILRMVAEHRISAEEAAQLLDALETPEHPSSDDREPRERENDDAFRYYYYRPRYRSRHRQRHRHRYDQGFAWSGFSDMFSGVTGMFQDLSGMFQDVFCGAFTGDTDKGRTMTEPEQAFDLPEGTVVEVVLTGGHLAVRGIDGEQMRVAVNARGGPRGPTIHVDEDGKRAQIAATGRDLTVELPWRAVGLNARVTGGHVSVSDLSADVDLRAVGGNASLQDVTGAVTAHVVGGNVKMQAIQSNEIDAKTTGGRIAVSVHPAHPVTEGRITLKTLSGDVAVTLPSASAFELDASAKTGRIATNLPDAPAPEAHGPTQTLRHTYNGGGAALSVSTRAGYIQITVTDPSATERIDDTEETVDA